LIFLVAAGAALSGFAPSRRMFFGRESCQKNKKRGDINEGRREDERE